MGTQAPLRKTMSHDLFIQAHENGEDQPLKTADVLDCFKGFIESVDELSVRIRFSPEQSSTLFLEAKVETNSGLMINRPCTDNRLVDCLYTVMKLGNCVYYEPGRDYLVVLREATLAHLPEGMADSFGEPRIASSAEEFATNLKSGWVTSG